MSLRRALAGAIAGGIAAAAGWLFAQATGETTFAVIPLLAVTLVGLALGSVAALWTYGVVLIATIGQAIFVPNTLVSSADAIRVAAFILGGPLVVLLAFRTERRREATMQAHVESAAAEQAAVRERSAADAARRETQAALQLADRERARLQEVSDAIPEPLIVYGADGRGTSANRAALRTFGRSFYDQAIEDWERLAKPRDERGEPLPQADWPQLKGREEVVRRRMLVRLPMSGRDVLVDVEGTPIPGGGSVLLLRDVGKEVDERRRLSRFGSFVAHELRNPLAVAKARIELAGREPDLPTRVASHGQRALESVDAAIAILERLELFSRAEAGRIETSDEDFDLRQAVASAIEHLRVRGSEREVEVAVVDEAVIRGDRALTQQALTNLLSNADRYSDEGQPIVVEIRGGPTPEVRVSDSGPGIPEELAGQLFVERVSSGRGLGLGLYLVRAAMEAQGGSVRLEQRQPGAIFVLRWPPRPAPAG